MHLALPQFDAHTLDDADACAVLRAYPEVHMYAVKLWVEGGNTPYIRVMVPIHCPATEYSTF